MERSVIERWIFLRDARLSGRTRLAIAALVLLSLVVLFPLRVALGWAAAGGAEISARAAEGTVWSGRIVDARAGSLPIGTLDAGLRPLPLLIGRSELWLRRPASAGDPFSARLSGGSGWLRLREVNGTLPLGDAAGGLPLTSIGFADFRLDQDGGRCSAADGLVTLTLASISPLMPANVAMTGKARCDKGALYVPMTGPSGMERLFLRIEGDGRYTAELVLSGLPVEVSTPLLDMGFSARPGGIGLKASGTL
ncbi:type II secretion system protein N [Novosphingobium lentum]|uniref:type II secretion system protein N n=1 Tax=Novosphingobium lentum TaxID=145287 RepID=UPI00082F364E|nr:type II secretion system protein N [Novosphingobium lentum]